MTPYIEQRNEKIRYRYRRAMEGKNNTKQTSEQAISELVRDFSAFQLSHETIRRIIFDPNYGRDTEHGIQLKISKDADWQWLKNTEGDVMLWTKAGDAQEFMKKYVRDLPKGKRPHDIRAKVYFEKKAETP